MLTTSLFKDYSNDTTQDKSKAKQKITYTHKLADDNHNKEKLKVIEHNPHMMTMRIMTTTTITYTLRSKSKG
jgi:hypothetical protein